MTESTTPIESTGLRAKRFSVGQLLTAGVAAVAVLIGSFGLGLWPSAAEAQGSIRKFSGPLETDTGWVTVRVHNPHPTSTLKATVVGRGELGTAISNLTQSVAPNAVNSWAFNCNGVTCTVEVNMANAILQPSAYYNDYTTKTKVHLHSGDFSR